MTPTLVVWSDSTREFFVLNFFFFFFTSLFCPRGKPSRQKLGARVSAGGWRARRPRRRPCRTVHIPRHPLGHCCLRTACQLLASCCCALGLPWMTTLLGGIMECLGGAAHAAPGAPRPCVNAAVLLGSPCALLRAVAAAPLQKKIERERKKKHEHFSVFRSGNHSFSLSLIFCSFSFLCLFSSFLLLLSSSSSFLALPRPAAWCRCEPLHGRPGCAPPPP